MATWKFVLADTNNVPLGEVQNASQRQVVLPLNKLPTASFTIRLDNPLAPYLMAGTSPLYLKAYRTISGGTPQIMFNGEVVTAQEAASRDTATIAVNAVQGWRISRRLVIGAEIAVTELNPSGGQSLPFLFNYAENFATIGSYIVPAVNYPLNVDYVTGPFGLSGPGTEYYWTSGPLSDAVDEVSVTFGFDWRLVALETWANSASLGNQQSRFEEYDVLGSAKPNSVFEWGGGKANIASYQRTMDRSTQANWVAATSAGTTIPLEPNSAADTTSITTWGLLPDVVQTAFNSAAYCAALSQEHVAVRKNPREILAFTPHLDPYDSGRLPQFSLDYVVGDVVTARGFFGGNKLFDLQVRVWGVTFDISVLGIEQQTLQLSES